MTSQNQILVFISHKVDTEGELAKTLGVELRKSPFVQTFISSEDIQPGQMWPTEINKNVQGCHIMITMMTDDWLNSKECETEYNMARKLNLSGKNIRIIPVYKDYQSASSHHTGMFILANYNGFKMDARGEWIGKIITEITKLKPILLAAPDQNVGTFTNLAARGQQNAGSSSSSANNSSGQSKSASIDKLLQEDYVKLKLENLQLQEKTKDQESTTSQILSENSELSSKLDAEIEKVTCLEEKTQKMVTELDSLQRKIQQQVKEFNAERKKVQEKSLEANAERKKVQEKSLEANAERKKVQEQVQKNNQLKKSITEKDSKIAELSEKLLAFENTPQSTSIRPSSSRINTIVSDPNYEKTKELINKGWTRVDEPFIGEDLYFKVVEGDQSTDDWSYNKADAYKQSGGHPHTYFGTILGKNEFETFKKLKKFELCTFINYTTDIKNERADKTKWRWVNPFDEKMKVTFDSSIFTWGSCWPDSSNKILSYNNSTHEFSNWYLLKIYGCHLLEVRIPHT